jgi:hypothetical protein
MSRDSAPHTARERLTGQLTGFVVSQAVYVAAKLGIPDLLADGPRTATELAVAAGADPDGLYRLLRLLAGHGIFTEQADGEGTFVNSPRSELLRDEPGSLRAFALYAGETAYPALGATRRMVQTGEPAFELVFGAVWEQHLATNLEARACYDRLLAARAQNLAEVLATHAWHGDETVVDIGGGGALLLELLPRREGLRGIVFDLPEAARGAAERLDAAGLADRCQIVAVAPPNHPGGKAMDLLLAAVGGRARTTAEWRALLADGGFELTGVRPGPNASILDAAPR